jgi:hypothetical protein
MASDPDGKDLTVNYPGGALTMTVGAWKALFGVDTPILVPIPETKTVTVKSHSRVRVIGQPASNVTGFSYDFTQWPTSQANNAAAGDVILMSWEGSDGQWTGRITGAMSDLATFLSNNSLKPVQFRSERGTKYGPFQLAV